MSAEEIPEFKEISAAVHGTLVIVQVKRAEKLEKEGKSRQKR